MGLHCIAQGPRAWELVFDLERPVVVMKGTVR